MCWSVSAAGPANCSPGARRTEQDEAPFVFEDHRWRRFLVAFARLEETLARAAEVWGDEASAEGFRAFVKTQLANPPSFAGSTPEWRQAVFERFDGLMRCVRDWGEKPLRSDPNGQIPHPPTDMRITPKQ